MRRRSPILELIKTAALGTAILALSYSLVRLSYNPGLPKAVKPKASASLKIEDVNSDGLDDLVITDCDDVDHTFHRAGRVSYKYHSSSSEKRPMFHDGNLDGNPDCTILAKSSEEGPNGYHWFMGQRDGSLRYIGVVK